MTDRALDSVSVPYKFEAEIQNRSKNLKIIFSKNHKKITLVE